MNKLTALLFALLLALVSFGVFAGSPVNVNKANAEEIAKGLDGIGPKKAQAIVEYRQKQGPFKTAEDLLKIKGIGQKTLDKNKAFIKLTDASVPTSASPEPAPKKKP